MLLDIVELSSEAEICIDVVLLSVTIAVAMLESAIDKELDELESGMDVIDSGSEEGGVLEEAAMEPVDV